MTDLLELERAAPADPTDPAGFIRIEASLAQMLKRKAKPAQALVIARVLGMFGDPPTTEGGLASFEAAIRAELQGMALPTVTATKPVIATSTRSVYARTRNAMRRKLRLGAIDFRFSRTDHEAVRFLRDQHTFFMRSATGTVAKVQSVAARRIVGEGLLEGLGTSQIADQLRAEIGNRLRKAGYMETLASLYVNRTRTASELNSYARLGIERFRFEAVLDERTCFSAETMVVCDPSGRAERIDRIMPGDVVISGNGKRRKVLARKEVWAYRWQRIRFEDGSEILSTETHPFWSSGRWIEANQIRQDHYLGVRGVPERGSTSKKEAEEGCPDTSDPGSDHSVLPTPEGRLRVVSSESVGINLRAYDLQVDADHSYLVGPGLIAHNTDICHFMDGKEWSVGEANASIREAGEAPEPEAVKFILPFMKQRKDSDGDPAIQFLQEDGTHRTVAKVLDSAIGTRGEGGKYDQLMTEKQMQDAGLGPPPAHFRCRSDAVPA